MEVGARRCRGSVRKNLAEEDREGQRTAGSPCSAPGCLVGGRARPACAAGMPRTDACAAYAAGAGVAESLLGGPVPVGRPSARAWPRCSICRNTPAVGSRDAAPEPAHRLLLGLAAAWERVRLAR